MGHIDQQYMASLDYFDKCLLFSVCPGIPSGTMSGFMRRLFLQVLLEDEKVTISLESDTHLYKGGNLPKHPGLQHPSTGAGHKYRTLQVSLSTTVSQLIGMVTSK